MKEPTRKQRADHRHLVEQATTYAKQALQSAEETGRRKDCLRSAVQALEGALKNITGEDAEAENKGK